MADSQVGVLVNLNESDDVPEIENTRMVADPEMAACIMSSPTLPQHRPGKRKKKVDFFVTRFYSQTEKSFVIISMYMYMFCSL